MSIGSAHPRSTERRGAAAAVHDRQQRAEQRGGAGVADLGAQQLVVDDRGRASRRRTTAALSEPGGRGRAGVVARERRLVERPGDEVGAHADRDEREAASGRR